MLLSVLLFGTAVGAGTGALIGKKMDKAAAEAKQIEGAQVETDNRQQRIASRESNIRLGYSFHYR